MGLKFYNTLTRKKEVFKPIHKNKVGMYSCGPTVYDYAHVGNLRTYIFNDVLKRSLEFLGYKVTHVMNITDVDDKIIKASLEHGTSLKHFTREYEKIFFEDLKELNIKKPTRVLRATESINDMIGIIKKLLEKGAAYKTNDGIYFDIGKSKDYGKLAQLGKMKKTKSRIASDEYDKKNVNDFALWKFRVDEDGENFWGAPFGKGRPGWHIECSAMSMKILGPSLDLHTGAIDLIFPHHTNEIAQSEAVTGKKFVRYWLHAGFLTLEKAKMSKSLGNILKLKDVKEMGFSPLDYRYLILTTHYREPLVFSTKNLQSARTSLKRIKNIISELKDGKKTNKKYLANFKKSLEDDLNMPNALQILWNLLRDEKAEGKIQTIKKMDEVFGLNLLKKEKFSIPPNIKTLAEERQKARSEKDFGKADELRDKINALGYFIEDMGEKYSIKKRDLHEKS